MRHPTLVSAIAVLAIQATVALLLPPLAFAQTPAARPWMPLFDGKTLGKWKESEFPRREPIRVENGTILLPNGKPFSGVAWSDPFPKTNYELRFEAARIKGGDFFASVTFPVAESHATLVLGGWGGDIVGISSIDGWDASDNETRTYFTFDLDRWYAFRLLVTEDRIQAWIDAERVVNVDIRGRAITLRQGDMKLATPLGFTSYNTAGGIRKIEYRPLVPKESNR